MRGERRRSRRLGRVVWACIALGGFVASTQPSGCGALIDPPTQTVLPPADAEPGRWIIVDGANNTRDIGGYATMDGRTVKWQTVYRSGELSDLTAAGCEAFRNLRIRRVVNFRNQFLPTVLFDGDSVCVSLASRQTLLPTLVADGGSYVETVRIYAGNYRQAFELLADAANLPLLYHCSSGKDRTGIMTILLLTLLGVDRETVMADYGLSDLVEATTDPQAASDLLDEIDRQGGIEVCLSGMGVSLDVQDAIRVLLLE
ncbi:MAG: tyrosine-protein phosphatase [Planctomycetes bacterium]|nr:tyrosine-protein phosphatase [Planctomycetota bacterium]